MQPNISSFDEFLSTQSYQIPLGGFIVNLVLATILSLLIGFIYIRYGTALSNRRAFARNFLLVAVTVMFIITVVKSSLALSLGLVGALSIVRFRTAVKDPEELAFILIAIAIGLGLGADQRAISIVATLFVIGLVIARYRYSRRTPARMSACTSRSWPGGRTMAGSSRWSNSSSGTAPAQRFADSMRTTTSLRRSSSFTFPTSSRLAALRREIAALPGEHEVAFLDPELR